jgi:hypothetical protein
MITYQDQLVLAKNSCPLYEKLRLNRRSENDEVKWPEVMQIDSDVGEFGFIEI